MTKQQTLVPYKGGRDSPLTQALITRMMFYFCDAAIPQQQGRQEDAEEFLGCLLDGLHEEMVSAGRLLQGHDREGNGSAECVCWEGLNIPLIQVIFFVA